MECLFIDRLNNADNLIELPESESRHAKSLRLANGDEILITNGRGLTAKSIIKRTGKESYEAQCIQFYENMNELSRSITIALPILDSKDRFEFSIEKAVELGVREIIPFYSDFSAKIKFSTERIATKIIAALKQSKRSWLPLYRPPVQFKEIEFNDFSTIFLGDENGGKIDTGLEPPNNILTICGPEGGFSDAEMQKLIALHNVVLVKTACSRLRSETASIALLSAIINKIML